MSGLLVDAVVVDDVRVNAYFLGFEFFVCVLVVVVVLTRIGRPHWWLPYVLDLQT